MSSKESKEFFVEMPWGRVGALAWGDPANPPILMIHGWMDTAAAFIPLVEGLPDDNYYVAFDYPGMGKSDPFPPGVMISQLHIVECVVKIVNHMKWDNFVCISHSLGCVITIYYNVLYPGKITKIVNADPGPGFSIHYYAACDEKAWMDHFLDGYYSNYQRYNSPSKKVYTFDKAVNNAMTTRQLSRSEAEISLSRMWVPAGNGKYKLSVDSKMKMLGSDFFSEETLIKFIRTNAPPILNLISVDRNRFTDEVESFIARLLKNAYEDLPNFTRVEIKGAHDAHITHAKEFVPHIVDFLNRSAPNRTVSAKL